MTTAREDTSRLADLLRREHHAMAGFLVALATFDRARRWEELGYASLFDFLRRELKLSAGAAQYRKAAAALVSKYPQVEAALRSGDLCLSSAIEVAKATRNSARAWRSRRRRSARRVVSSRAVVIPEASHAFSDPP